MNPTPAPTPTPVPLALWVPTRTAAEELADVAGLRALPHARLVLFSLELLLLLLFYILARWTLARLLRRLEGRMVALAAAHESAGRAARLRTLFGLTRSALQFVLGFVFLVSGLALLGVNIAAIIGTASIAGLAFGFGAQKLVKDVITGFFLLLEDQYVVGDFVTVGAVSGTVEELGMRITKIRDEDGRLYILSNGDIAQVCNQSRGPISGHFEVAIGAGADLSAASAAIDARLASVSETLHLAQAAKVEGISAADAAKTTLKIGFRAPAGQRPAAFLLRLREETTAALAEAGIPLG